jgi:hypothetical protein
VRAAAAQLAEQAACSGRATGGPRSRLPWHPHRAARPPPGPRRQRRARSHQHQPGAPAAAPTAASAVTLAAQHAEAGSQRLALTPSRPSWPPACRTPRSVWTSRCAPTRPAATCSTSRAMGCPQPGLHRGSARTGRSAVRERDRRESRVPRAVLDRSESRVVLWRARPPGRSPSPTRCLHDHRQAPSPDFRRS